jgi:site-specific DNA-methyltransferase (adenine-specific)
MAPLVEPIDCLKGLKLLKAGSVDMVFADLPYGATRNDWDKPLPMKKLWPELYRVCKPNAAMVFTAIQPFTSLLVCSNLKDFRYSMVWHKNKASGALLANHRPLRIHEDLLIFWRKFPTYNPQFTQGHAPSHGAHRHTGQGKNYGKTTPGTTYEAGRTYRYPTTVLEIPVVDSCSAARIHPTQKPWELAAWFIRSFSNPHNLILDPTAGSGSTLVAARILGRRATGFEKDHNMAEKANAWLNECGGTPDQTA